MFILSRHLIQNTFNLSTLVIFILENQIKGMAVGIATNLTNRREKNQQQMAKNISMMGKNLNRIARSKFCIFVVV